MTTPQYPYGQDPEPPYPPQPQDPQQFGCLPGNFIAAEDGGADTSGAVINQLGKSGHGETHVYDDAGSHFLSIDSECSWSVQVVG